MALRKDAAEKAARREAEDAARAAKAAAREQDRTDRLTAQAEAAFLRTPAGRATVAKERCDGFFEIELTPAITAAAADRVAPPDDGRVADYRGVLAEIEAVGWHLEHVTYLREPRDGVGKPVTSGIYLFRNAETTALKLRRRRRDGAGVD